MPTQGYNIYSICCLTFPLNQPALQYALNATGITLTDRCTKQTSNICWMLRAGNIQIVIKVISCTVKNKLICRVLQQGGSTTLPAAGKAHSGMPAHGCPAVYSFASLLLYLLVNALVLESEVDTMLSLDLFWTYFRLLHLNRILNRVIRIAVVIATGCHFYFIAR